MSRYLDAPETVIEMMNNIKKEHFPELANCKIKILMDSKKKMNKGNYVFGRIKSTNELEKYLTADNMNTDGNDFIMFLDSNLFDNITIADEEKIIRHELRHLTYDSNSNSNPYKLVGHDVEDFKAELELNKDDMDWKDRVSSIAESIYSKD